MVSDTLPSLGYFVEWGGRSWERLFRCALREIGTLEGKQLLEIGPRLGKLSAYFALHGAQVTGIETDPAVLKQAEHEARQWGVETGVSFVHYDGDLDHCYGLKESAFDLVFTKSVLVLLGDDLRSYLEKLNRKLKPTGQCVFIENGHGGPIFSIARRILRRRDPHRVTYLTESHLSMIDEVFRITYVKKCSMPPIYLIIARKR